MMKMFLQNYNQALVLLTFLNLQLHLVAETKQPISVYDISQDEVSKYVDVVEKNNGLFSLVKESFDMDFHIYRGINDQELQTASRRIPDKLLQKLVNQIVLIGGNGVKYANRTSDNGVGFKTAFIAFRRNFDGNYDVVYCTAEQTREINWEKIGFTTVIAGTTALAVSLTMPGVGFALGSVIVGATAAAPTGIAFVQQNFMEMQNVVIGYIGKELSERKLLVLN